MPDNTTTSANVFNAFTTDVNSLPVQLKNTFSTNKWFLWVANFIAGNSTTIASGDVIPYTVPAVYQGTVYNAITLGTTVYRYITTAETLGYPTIDAFYNTFDGTNIPTAPFNISRGQ